MRSLIGEDYETLSRAFAFLGNSLLEPMSKTSDVGASAEFWRAFPSFDDKGVASALSGLASYAEAVQRASRGGASSVVEACSYEHTRLFVGPPHPEAAPWESAYCQDGKPQKRGVVGFGEATHEMRCLLRQAGFELRNENNQYEDHMGIELLFLSELCSRAAADKDGANGEEAARFAQSHPLAWIDGFSAKASEAAPGGYFEGLLRLAKALLEVVS